MPSLTATPPPSSTSTPTSTASLQIPPYLDTSRSFEERAADLVSRLTLAEKVGQLSTTNAPGIPRLGVQEYAYWSEAQHGLSQFHGGYADDPLKSTTVKATSFPTNLAASMTWNPALMRRETSAISDEARGALDKSLFGNAQNNIGSSASGYGNLFYWSPTVNIARDPRWGRTDEAFGEDPFLAGTMGAAWVNGFQGQDARGRPEDRYLKAVATEKHLALNNNEKDRMATSSDTDETTIREYYTAQFRRLVEDAHVSGVMTSYNAVNGTPAAANHLLANVLLRNTWGFDGYTTSDCGGVATIYRNPNVPRDPISTAAKVSGHDWAPPGWTTDHGDDLGHWTQQETGTTVSAPAGAQAFALRSGTTLNCVGAGTPGNEGLWDLLRHAFGGEHMLENIQEAIAAGILSEDVIDRGLIRVFTLRFRLGEFDPIDRQEYTKLSKDQIESPTHRALAQAVAEQALTLLKNDAPAGGQTPLLPTDPAATKQVVVVGDQASKVFLGGYAGEPSDQVPLLEGIRRIVPGVEVVYDDAGTSSTATAEPSLKPQTLTAIRDADLVVVMVGTDAATNKEDLDRPSIAMPGNYGPLIDQVAAVGNPRIALVVQSAGPVDLTAARDKVASIVYSAANGQRQGVAAANVLFGRTNPSGRLSFTWYRDDTQLPPMLDYGITPSRTGGLGRTYQYFTGIPVYPFGFGLSYTTFRWSNIGVSAAEANANDTVRITLTVENTGSRTGADVVEIYGKTPVVGGRDVPLRRLVGFSKTRDLAPGETQPLTIEIPLADTLRLWDDAAKRSRVYPGDWAFEISRAAGDTSEQRLLRISGDISPAIRHLTAQPPKTVLHVGDTIGLHGKNPWLEGLGPTGTDPHPQDILTAVRADDSFVDLSEVELRFSSTDPAVVEVTEAGVVSAVGSGVATITATLGGETAGMVFVVR